MSLATVDTRYHVVPLWRFVLLSLITVGVYEVYWFYKQWQHIKAADRSDIWPFPRAIFAGFTYFSLIDDMNNQGLARGIAPLSKVFAVLFFISNVASRLPDPWPVVEILGFLALIPAVKHVWSSASEQQRAASEGFATRHIVASVLGVLCWALVLAGYLFPEPEPVYGGPYSY